MKIDATFIASAADARQIPRDGLGKVTFVGRSNVGKSSLINALVRQRLARTSGAPGKTRLANIYRVVRGAAPPFYLVDLPGYGYAGGGPEAARAFDELTKAFFGENCGLQIAEADRPSALLLVDARHPGLERDLRAWEWVRGAARNSAVVATKIDKLTRGERIRATRELESVFDVSVRPVSAATGEGLDELWKLIDRLANNPNSKQRSRLNKPHRLNNRNKLTNCNSRGDEVEMERRPSRK